MKDLNMKKVCAILVPENLSRKEVFSALSSTVVGRIWPFFFKKETVVVIQVFHYNPETKSQNSGVFKIRKVLMSKSKTKTMLTCFLILKEISILIHSSRTTKRFTFKIWYVHGSVLIEIDQAFDWASGF
jgi:hypothetical protein